MEPEGTTQDILFWRDYEVLDREEKEQGGTWNKLLTQRVCGWVSKLRG